MRIRDHLRDHLRDYLLPKRLWRQGGMRKNKKKKRHVEDKVVGSKLGALVQIFAVLCFDVGTFTLTPVVEEYSFRGFLMASLSSWVATPMAMVISSVIFALAHRNCPELPHLFVGGLTFGLIYAQTRNLGTPIAMHAMWNFGASWRELIRSLTEIKFCRSWTTFATKYFSKRWPQPKTRDSINTGHELDQLTGSPKLSIVLPPVVEEYVYKGSLMASLTKWLVTTIVVVISSFIIAFVHWNSEQVSNLFVGVLAFGITYAKTRNLTTAVAMHLLLVIVQLSVTFITFISQSFSRGIVLLHPAKEASYRARRKRKNKLVGKH